MPDDLSQIADDLDQLEQEIDHVTFRPAADTICQRLASIARRIRALHGQPADASKAPLDTRPSA